MERVMSTPSESTVFSRSFSLLRPKNGVRYWGCHHWRGIYMHVVRKLNATKENEPSPVRKLRQNLQNAIRYQRILANNLLGGMWNCGVWAVFKALVAWWRVLGLYHPHEFGDYHNPAWDSLWTNQHNTMIEGFEDCHIYFWSIPIPKCCNIPIDPMAGEWLAMI